MAMTQKGPQRPKAAIVAKSIATRLSLPAVDRLGAITSRRKLLVASKVKTPELRESNPSIKPRLAAKASMMIGRSTPVPTTIVQAMNADNLEMFNVGLISGMYHKVRSGVNRHVSQVSL